MIKFKVSDRVLAREFEDWEISTIIKIDSSVDMPYYVEKDNQYGGKTRWWCGHEDVKGVEKES